MDMSKDSASSSALSFVRNDVHIAMLLVGVRKQAKRQI